MIKLLAIGVLSMGSISSFAGVSDTYALISGSKTCSSEIEFRFDDNTLKSNILSKDEIDLNTAEKMKEFSHGRLMDMGPGGARIKRVTKASSASGERTINFKIQVKEQNRPGDGLFDDFMNSLGGDKFKVSYISNVTELIYDKNTQTLDVRQLRLSTNRLVSNPETMFSYIELQDEDKLIEGQKEVTANGPAGEFQTLNYDVYSNECYYQKQ